MKILKRNSEYKKMPDKNFKDLVKIENLIDEGWRYITRKDWKDNVRDVNPPTRKERKNVKK